MKIKKTSNLKNKLPEKFMDKLLKKMTPYYMSQNIWISRNSGCSLLVDLWIEKPKRHTKKLKIKDKKGKKKTVVCYYVMNGDMEMPGLWINSYVVEILFGIVPKEGELLGPFTITSQKK